MNRNKIIVIFCHSRAELLGKCIESLKLADGINTWKVVICQQLGHAEVSEVISRNKSFFEMEVRIKPQFNQTLGNINFNRVTGTSIAFDLFNADYVLGIEEDNLIAKDSLGFVDFIYSKYNDYKLFRGINLSSIESGKGISSTTYSLLRSGLHGSAGVLTKRSWEMIKKKKLLEFIMKDPNAPWDSQIEFFLKSGFMIVPNLSRNLDLGYGGTFAPKSENDPYFISIKDSWDQVDPLKDFYYSRSQITHTFKVDIISFRMRHQIFYYFRSFRKLSSFTSKVGINKFISRWFLNK